MARTSSVDANINYRASRLGPGVYPHEIYFVPKLYFIFDICAGTGYAVLTANKLWLLESSCTNPVEKLLPEQTEERVVGPKPRLLLEAGNRGVIGFDKERAMQELKERGIYTLPSERGELVAHAVFCGGYALYKPTDWEFFGPYTYDSDAAGNIRREGQSTRWHIDDLAYTNRTARSRSRSGAAQKCAMSE